MLRVFENRMLRKIFVPTMDETTGYWRILHTEQLHDFCSSPNVIEETRSRIVRWAVYVSGTELSCTQGFGSSVKARERPLGRPRCNWEEDIRMDVLEIGYCSGMD